MKMFTQLVFLHTYSYTFPKLLSFLFTINIPQVFLTTKGIIEFLGTGVGKEPFSFKYGPFPGKV